MEKKIQVRFFVIASFFAVLALGMTVHPAFGQLSSGDVAFTGFNSNGLADGYSVVLLSSVSGNQKLHFTSKEWNGNSFTGNGGSITWEAPPGVTTAGTVLVFNNIKGVPSVNIGTIIDGTTMDLSTSGDIIYAFLGPEKDRPAVPSDNAFLGTISTSVDLYSQPDGTEGTLANTGLSVSGNKTILLPENTNGAEYNGSRSGNNPSDYRSLLNDIGTEGASNDNWDTYNGKDVASFPPFDGTNFVINMPPTVAFTTSSASVDEDGDDIDLTVELLEANGTAVDVEVAFVGESSSAAVRDIDNFTTQTVSFSSSASNGDTKVVTVNITNDSNFEGTEKSVFRLQNNVAGSITAPDVLTLNIIDDDAPDIVFNEINADPGDDANGDGVTESDADRFIELVNHSGNDMDMSGWIYADSESDRFKFPDGTIIGAGGAVVLFGEGSQVTKGNFGGAYIFRDIKIGLSHAGETLTLKDENGAVIESTTYSNKASGQSNVLSPEITGTSYVDHSTASGSDGSLSSPGTKVDGTAFGSHYAVGIRGSVGWRMISTPTTNTTFADLFDNFWMQGITGSDDPAGKGTIFSWDETSGGSFSAPSGLSSTLTPGKGYIIYVFEDDKFNTPGVQDGFPKIVSTNKSENSGTVSLQVTANDNNDNSTIDNNEGWNLLGNPFGTDISIDALITALEKVDPSVNTNVLVWNPDTDSYETLSNGDTIAPFQAFFVRYTKDGVDGRIELIRSTLAANAGATFYKNRNETEYRFSISLHGPEYSDSFHVSFSNKGEVALDRYDAYKLFSLNPNAINLYGVKGANKLLKNELPEDLNKKAKIPLSFVAPDRQKLQFKWEGLRSLPPGWTVRLIDRELNQEVDMSRTSEYKFTADLPLNNHSPAKEEPLYAKTSKDNGDIRFVLTIEPGTVEGVSGNKLPDEVKLNPNYPNPFNAQTTLSFELKEESDVTLTVWNMIGQKVKILVDGTREAGKHTETWNAANLPSGIYIARFEVGSQVFTRKMTLIK